MVGNRASRKGSGQAWAHRSCGGPGRGCTFLELQNLPAGVYTTAEAGDGDQPGGTQVHSWEGLATLHTRQRGSPAGPSAGILHLCSCRGLGRLPVQIPGPGGAGEDGEGLRRQVPRDGSTHGVVTTEGRWAPLRSRALGTVVVPAARLTLGPTSQHCWSLGGVKLNRSCPKSLGKLVAHTSPLFPGEENSF